MVEGITNEQRQELDAAAIQRELMNLDQELADMRDEFLEAVRDAEEAKAKAAGLKSVYEYIKTRRSTLQSVLRTL